MTADPVEAIYNGHCQNQRHGTARHLPRLRSYADGCDLAVEFGAQHGAATSALLLGARCVISYDLDRSPRLDALAAAAGDRLMFCRQDSRGAPVQVCDLLFLDSLHTYAQVSAELDRHAGAVRRWLIFHDTMTFGSVGADGDSGCLSYHHRRGEEIPREHYGIRLAIDEFQMRNPHWRIYEHYPESHGLLVLGRQP